MIDILSMTAIVLIVVVVCLIQRRDHKKERLQWADERAEWAEERKMLLDRLSARNLTEYARVRGELQKAEPVETAHDRAIKAWRYPNAQEEIKQ